MSIDSLPAPTVVAFSDLLPGDILLYRPVHPDAVQREASEVTQSPYTHAGIYGQWNAR